jgi:hypothetical protein
MRAVIGVERMGQRRRTRQRCCVLALLLCASAANAQNIETESATPAPAPEKPPEVRKEISYVDGQLKIDALNATLADVLAKVAALTGVKIDLPEGATSEPMPVVDLGPGPAREILASLLRDSNFDYLILASDKDPEKVQSVVLMTREKRGSGTNGTNGIEAVARPIRSPYSRAGAPPPRQDEPAPPDPPAPVQPENTVAGVNSPNGSTQPDPSSSSPSPQPDSSTSSLSTQPDLSVPPPFGQPLQTNIPPVFPVSPPAVMNQQTMSQQLQQMYQQRMQMLQQDRQIGQPAVPGSPTTK